MEGSSSCTFDSLPTDLLDLIISHVDVKALLSLCQVNKEIGSKIDKASTIWKNQLNRLPFPSLWRLWAQLISNDKRCFLYAYPKIFDLHNTSQLVAASSLKINDLVCSTTFSGETFVGKISKKRTSKCGRHGSAKVGIEMTQVYPPTKQKKIRNDIFPSTLKVERCKPTYFTAQCYWIESDFALLQLDDACLDYTLTPLQHDQIKWMMEEQGIRDYDALFFNQILELQFAVYGENQLCFSKISIQPDPTTPVPVTVASTETQQEDQQFHSLGTLQKEISSSQEINPQFKGWIEDTGVYAPTAFIPLPVQDCITPRRITPEELASHNSPDSCWMRIENYVYDVTSYIKSHPGGPKILLHFGGSDATEIFQNLHQADERNILKKLPIVGQSETVPRLGFNSLNDICGESINDTHFVKEATEAFSKFRELIMEVKFPCVCAKAALTSGTFVFRFYRWSGQLLKQSLSDLKQYIELQQPKLQQSTYSNNFTTFICVFQSPSFNLKEHVHAMYTALHSKNEDPNKAPEFNSKKISHYFFHNVGFFVPGAHPKEMAQNVLAAYPWPVLVFNSLSQFADLGSEFSLLRQIIFRRLGTLTR